jgi:nucleotide-binding universal stress UspA family protein
MNTTKMHLLLVTNGCDESCDALDYGIWLAAVLQTRVTILGVAETVKDRSAIDELVIETALRLTDAKIEHQVLVRDGQTEDVLKRLVPKDQYDLLVIGRLGRPSLLRWLRGRSFRHIMAKVDLPILYVPEARMPARKVLVCLGGLGYGMTVENMGLRLAAEVGADVTLLHVVAPIDLDYPTARTVRENWDHLTDTDTLLGRVLRKGLASARETGLETVLKVRQGSVVEEILSEIKTGDYDLVCMGSPHSTHALRQLYQPNVTAEVAEAAGCPVLTARFNPPPTTDPE